MSQIVRDTGLTAADAWAIADDRSTWRALRPIAGYAQQWVRSEFMLRTCYGDVTNLWRTCYGETV